MNEAAYLMEIIAGLLSLAVLEGDWTGRTCEHRPIWRNGDGTVRERKRDV